ncbi:hypothetical protein F511_36396 [Dorcoceras hygrometricum]|uniref:Uncharacterized protein n=1 Tax=Dorcoceras hygrometricum TaxID=472368 RepID=A0A2Z7AWX2_9LAMI|nr:hypothetical protein F511_36396 [Dorcoceras hygrometricum]
MKPIKLKTPPEVGLRGLNSTRHMKVVLRWIRERQKVKLLCNHVGPHKHFLYTTWFTKPGNKQIRHPGVGTSTSISKSS